MAILLLPVYTRYVGTTGYGIVETLATFVILVSIVVRLGMIESFLRFYLSTGPGATRCARAPHVPVPAVHDDRRGVGPVPSRLTAVVLVTASPKAIPGTFRIAVLGVWAFTNLEFAYAMLRVDERLRAYATATLANVALTIAFSLVLVVGLHRSYNGLLLANYGVSALVLIALWWTMRAQALPPPRRRRDASRTRCTSGCRRFPPRRLCTRSASWTGSSSRRARTERGAAVLAGGQDRGGDRLYRARIPIRVAAVGLFDHRRC